MSTSSQSSVFRGDNEDLIDHLIFACHEHKANQPLDSFGRELVPFFLPGEPLAPLPNKHRHWQSCGSPPRSGSNNVPKSSSKAGRKASPPVRCGPSAELHAAAQVPRPRACGASLNGSSVSPAASSSNLFTPQLSSRTSFASLGHSPPSGPACPAFFSSPKPDAIPMPTSLLLTKAANVVGFIVPPAAA